ncbi:MAG: hypothetical protein QGH99_07235 [Pseudomonadales bacterium]|jgi:hypothetical protein|nr:hypothetical protein [Pseudomonadales bacterium]MDP7576743.1 hypothetical protein [Pseudomonadales bacterium]|tara:strand:+ start:17751 stop:17927 length:177 start_codon:yes stop_codon:yes gene_type:complete
MVMLVILSSGVQDVIAEEGMLSDRYSMDVDPEAEARLGGDTYNEVMSFFCQAELASES